MKTSVSGVPRLGHTARLALVFAATLILPLSSAICAESPEQLYVLNCWGCHLPQAQGIPGTVPPLADAMANFLRVPGGRAFLVQVPGVSSSRLNDEQIAEVLNWLLVTFNKNEIPKDFVPYNAEEVQRYRADKLLNVGATRAGLVLKMRQQGIKLASP